MKLPKNPLPVSMKTFGGLLLVVNALVDPIQFVAAGAFLVVILVGSARAARRIPKLPKGDTVNAIQTARIRSN
jgi:hypothetical protein